MSYGRQNPHNIIDKQIRHKTFFYFYEKKNKKWYKTYHLELDGMSSLLLCRLALFENNCFNHRLYGFHWIQCFDMYISTATMPVMSSYHWYISSHLACDINPVKSCHNTSLGFGRGMLQKCPWWWSRHEVYLAVIQHHRSVDLFSKDSLLHKVNSLEIKMSWCPPKAELIYA